MIALKILEKAKIATELLLQSGLSGFCKSIEENTLENIKKAIEEIKQIEMQESYKICKNCESWQNECCMQTEFENGTKAEDKCFIVGFRAKK